MSENEIVRREDPRSATGGDAPAVTHVIPAEELKQLTQVLSDVAKDYKAERTAMGEATERAARVLADIEKAQKMSKPVVPSDNGPARPVSIERLMQRRSHEPKIVEMQETADRALCRAIVRAGKSGQLGFVSDGSRMMVNLKSIPAPLWEQIPEYLDLRDQISLDAGSFIDTTTSTSGSQWVPTGFSRMAVDFYFLDSGVETAFTQQMIPEGVGSFSVPIETARGQAQIDAQATSVQSAYIDTTGIKTPLTGVISFTPKKLSFGYQWSMEANEDLAVDMLQRALRQVPAGIRRGVRQCIINGQTASDATLDDAPAASGLETADGWADATGEESLRLHTIVNGHTTAVGAALTFADTLTGRKAMGKFGANPAELALVLSPGAYIGLLGDDTHVTTLEKFGPQATVLTGQLAAVGGVPVFFDSELLDTLDAGGINAGTGAVGGAVLFNRTRWWLATKRQIDVNIIPGQGMDVMTVLGRWRGDSQVAISTEHSAHYFINLT